MVAKRKTICTKLGTCRTGGDRWRNCGGDGSSGDGPPARRDGSRKQGSAAAPLLFHDEHITGIILAEVATALAVTLSGGALFASRKLLQFPSSLIAKVILAFFTRASAQRLPLRHAYATPCIVCSGQHLVLILIL